MAKLNLKSMKKSTKDHIITFAMVIVVYIIVQTMITTGNMSSLMQGLLVPMCTYSIVAIGLNLCVGYLGELSIGHAGFMCVGAFSSAFCTKLLHHLNTFWCPVEKHHCDQNDGIDQHTVILQSTEHLRKQC